MNCSGECFFGAYRPQKCPKDLESLFSPVGTKRPEVFGSCATRCGKIRESLKIVDVLEVASKAADREIGAAGERACVTDEELRVKHRVGATEPLPSQITIEDTKRDRSRCDRIVSQDSPQLVEGT